MAWLRRYFIAVGLIALGCVRWKYDLFIHTHGHGGRIGFQTWVNAMDFGSYFLAVFLLLCPWWRLGEVISGLSYAIALPSCTYVIAGLSVVDLLYVHQQTWCHCFLLSGVLAQVFWLFLRLGEESRQATIAHLWKERLREDQRERIKLVEQFILEIEGDDHDVSGWRRFAEASRKDDPMGMWKELDAEWEKWLGKRE